MFVSIFGVAILYLNRGSFSVPSFFSEKNIVSEDLLGDPFGTPPEASFPHPAPASEASLPPSVSPLVSQEEKQTQNLAQADSTSLSSRHKQCKSDFDERVAGAAPGLAAQVGDEWGDLSWSFSTFFSRSTGDCVGVVLVESVDGRLSSYFVFDARTGDLIDFSSGLGTAVFEDFVAHYDEM